MNTNFIFFFLVGVGGRWGEGVGAGVSEFFLTMNPNLKKNFGGWGGGELEGGD